jgi:hypothetical protein
MKDRLRTCARCERKARSSRRLGSEAPMMLATGRFSGSRLIPASRRLPRRSRVQWPVKEAWPITAAAPQRICTVFPIVLSNAPRHLSNAIGCSDRNSARQRLRLALARRRAIGVHDTVCTENRGFVGNGLCAVPQAGSNLGALRNGTEAVPYKTPRPVPRGSCD